MLIPQITDARYQRIYTPYTCSQAAIMDVDWTLSRDVENRADVPSAVLRPRVVVPVRTARETALLMRVSGGRGRGACEFRAVMHYPNFKRTCSCVKRVGSRTSCRQSFPANNSYGIGVVGSSALLPPIMRGRRPFLWDPRRW